MPRKRSAPIFWSYALFLAAAVVLLVVWVLYVVRSGAQLAELARRLGVTAEDSSWVVLGLGVTLFFVLIGGLTVQLAHSLAERRYSRKQEEFISNITHEMKSPLAAIQLHAQTLDQPGLTDDQRRRSLEFILQQAARMGRLVDNVLESSRLISRKHRLELLPLDLDAFLAGYFEEAEARAESQGVTLSTDARTGALILANEDALHRVLDNLLDNALRFTDRGGSVRCRAEGRAETVTLEIEDDGVGIPRGELAKIWDRFYQAGRQGDGRRQGTGLGLSIVSGLVREMNGTVTAHSQDGRPGTRFVIELPRLPEARLGGGAP